jgi:N-acetylneuraminate synthase
MREADDGTSHDMGTLIIAEAGVNHDGSLDDALALVDVAADAGADVVKFQTFDLDAVATATAPQAAYQRERAAADSQLEMLRRLHLDRASHEVIAERCAARGIEFLSTAFDEHSLAWLCELGLRRVKVPSGELTNGPLLLAYARTGLPLIVSTGMATLAEVERALAVLAYGLLGRAGLPTTNGLREAYGQATRDGTLREYVTLLHCTSQYPAEPGDVHLAAMGTLAAAFGLEVGYSDHTLGTAVPVAAVARGASVLEKHITLDPTRPGPDHAASLAPDRLRELVVAVRQVEQAIGSAIKQPVAAETDTIDVARRSLVVARPISAGQAWTDAHLVALRPGTGRSPMDYWELLGRSARRDYAAGEPVDAEE